eukprot:2891374-Rhodomonas_salina.1
MREYDERRKASSLQLAKSPMKLRRKQTAEQRMRNVTAIQKPKRVRDAVIAYLQNMELSRGLTISMI